MSKQILSNVANESMDQLECAREHMAWINSLCWSISTLIKSGNQSHAQQLANVASYLAHDYQSILDDEVKRLGDQLAAADLRA
ncbi:MULTISPECIES: hypothetical protein [Pseudomonas]|uniref:hypothetical protein n=1 Tax=Pseudomonas TaxID=286 RepID=UPI0002DDD4EB|nr:MULTISPECIES: hypothetical protein [Pseudomonas]ANC84698.1 hypothetical protein KKK_28240 [Pseudomonas putida B6-2]MCF3158795.1 hypothetical protein [Pseudomonas juntendi]